MMKSCFFRENLTFVAETFSGCWLSSLVGCAGNGNAIFQGAAVLFGKATDESQHFVAEVIGARLEVRIAAFHWRGCIPEMIDLACILPCAEVV